MASSYKSNTQGAQPLRQQSSKAGWMGSTGLGSAGGTGLCMRTNISHALAKVQSTYPTNSVRGVNGIHLEIHAAIVALAHAVHGAALDRKTHLGAWRLACAGRMRRCGCLGRRWRRRRSRGRGWCWWYRHVWHARHGGRGRWRRGGRRCVPALAAMFMGRGRHGDRHGAQCAEQQGGNQFHGVLLVVDRQSQSGHQMPCSR